MVSTHDIDIGDIFDISPHLVRRETGKEAFSPLHLRLFWGHTINGLYCVSFYLFLLISYLRHTGSNYESEFLCSVDINLCISPNIVGISVCFVFTQ